jgi:hypothetical protein
MDIVCLISSNILIMKAAYLFLEINKTEFIANKAIRAIESRVEHPIKDLADAKAIDEKFPISSKAIRGEHKLKKIATMEGFFIRGIECSISMN